MRQILSLVRLPIPPLRHGWLHLEYHSRGFGVGSTRTVNASRLPSGKRWTSTATSAPIGTAEGSSFLSPSQNVVFRVIFNQDGTVKRGPDVIGGKPNSDGPVFAESARRAILQCQPYTMLRKETSDNWTDMELAFRPSDMFR